MNILHVSLGLPPLRTGGLTRYCCELMVAQAKSGSKVSLLYPGRFLPGPVRFHKGSWHGIDTYELINPLPVALTYGVADPEPFVSRCLETGEFVDLIKSLSPDVIHVHSFMGIYREFFYVAKDMGIAIVFTTHDYYPMCPRSTLIDNGGRQCGSFGNAADCSTCCAGGMTLRKCKVMQSSLYASLKSSVGFSRLASAVKRNMSSKGHCADGALIDESKAEDYEALLRFNKSIFELFDLVLTNSNVTERAYRMVFPGASYKRQLISHEGLSSQRLPKREERSCGKFIIGYFGGQKEYKGYGSMIAASRRLHDIGLDFELRLYGDDYEDSDCNEAISCGRVPPEEMADILSGLDLVVVPSLYHETFGFVVLEALCAGVRVICSNVVGACELLGDDAIFPVGDYEALAERAVAASEGALPVQTLPEGYPLSMCDQVNALENCYEMAKVTRCE